MPPTFAYSLCPLSVPTLDNSDASLANLNSPLANSNTFSAAINASPDSSKPLEPSPTVPNSSACHQPTSLTSLDYFRLAQTALLGFPLQVPLVCTNPGALGYKHRTSCLPSKDSPSVAEPPYDIAKVSNTTKGRGKAREEDEKEEFEWQKALTVVDTGMSVGVVLKKAKGKTMVLLEEKKVLKKSKEHTTTAEQRMTQRGAGTLLAPNPAIVVIAKKKVLIQRKVIEKHWQEVCEEDSNEGGLGMTGQSFCGATVGKDAEDVEIEEDTPIATVAEVKTVASGGEVKGKQEVDEEKVMKVEKDKRSEEEKNVQQHVVWTNTPQQQALRHVL
ncbi:hypothetical protein E4T56_gene11338 [Termitomyces sp. T112]|nr:hypothetical protein E4T56_gene11338 [Termitomyces sp. T112]